MIVPLKTGSGTRIKIIQGLSLGKAIISTKKGMEGIPCENNKHAMITDSAEEMATYIIDLFEKDEKKKTLSENALQLVKDRYQSDVIVKQLQDILEEFKSVSHVS